MQINPVIRNGEVSRRKGTQKLIASLHHLFVTTSYHPCLCVLEEGFVDVLAVSRQKKHSKKRIIQYQIEVER